MTEGGRGGGYLLGGQGVGLGEGPAFDGGELDGEEGDEDDGGAVVPGSRFTDGLSARSPLLAPSFSLFSLPFSLPSRGGVRLGSFSLSE